MAASADDVAPYLLCRTSCSSVRFCLSPMRSAGWMCLLQQSHHELLTGGLHLLHMLHIYCRQHVRVVRVYVFHVFSLPHQRQRGHDWSTHQGRAFRKQYRNWWESLQKSRVNANMQPTKTGRLSEQPLLSTGPSLGARIPAQWCVQSSNLLRP